MLQMLLLSLFALCAGLVLLLWGYRTFLVMLPIFGFFAGFWLGAQVVAAVFGTGFLADVTGFATGFFVGVAAAVLSYLFYAFAVAFVAAAIGYGLGAGLMQAIGLDAWWLVIPMGIVVALVVLFLAFGLNLQKYVIIALTAIAGANALILAALLLLGRVSATQVQGAGNAIQPVLQDGWFWGLVWLAVAVLGVYYQIRSNRVYAFTADDYAMGWGQPN